MPRIPWSFIPTTTPSGFASRRYFDSIYSLRGLFKGHDFATTVRMGWSYQWREIRFIVTRYPGWILYYIAYNGAKIAGTLAAHVADYLPRRVARQDSACTGTIGRNQGVRSCM